MSGNLKENVARRSIWIRLVFMIVMSLAYGVAEAITVAVVVFQFLASLFTGQPNDRLIRFGRNMARYLQQIVVYMTFATEEKPFPFSPWPDEPHNEASGEDDSNPLNDLSENTGDAVGNDEAHDATEADGKDAADNAEDADKPKD